MIKKILFITVVFFSLNSLHAQNTAGQDQNSLNVIRTAVPFITIAPDSKAGAMGDAGVATSADINSQHWNASKYPFMEDRMGVSLSYTPWLRGLNVTDLNLLYLVGYYKLDDKMTLSGSIRYFNLGSIQEIDEFGDATGGKITPNEFTIDAGASRLFSDYFSMGLVFRFIRSDIANGLSLSTGQISPSEAGNSFAADYSIFYQKPIKISTYDAEMAYGLNISNIGGKLGYSENNEKQFIPTNMRLGGRLSMEIDKFNSFGVTMDLNKLLVPSPDSVGSSKIGVVEGMFKSLGDATGGGKEELREIAWSFGAEYWYMNQFAVRFGYLTEHETKGARKYITAGVGMNLNVFSLDFSYLFPTTKGGNSPLAKTMRFTLGFRFE
jgi:hypothetical protein